jgi:hypothetical protein
MSIRNEWPESRVSDRKIIPFRKRPPSPGEMDAYRRFTRNWSSELKRLMFPEYFRHDNRSEAPEAPALPLLT